MNLEKNNEGCMGDGGGKGREKCNYTTISKIKRKKYSLI